MSTLTDRDGHFNFRQLVAGDYTLRVQGKSGYGRTGSLKVRVGLPLTNIRLELQKVYKIKGVVDLSVYAKRGDYLYLHLRDEKTHEGRGTQIDSTTGAFEISSLPPGTYTGEIHCWGPSTSGMKLGYTPVPIVLRDDIEDLKIRPVFANPKAKKKTPSRR